MNCTKKICKRGRNVQCNTCKVLHTKAVGCYYEVCIRYNCLARYSNRLHGTADGNEVIYWQYLLRVCRKRVRGWLLTVPIVNIYHFINIIMLLTVTTLWWKKTLRELILAIDPTIIEKLNAWRIIWPWSTWYWAFIVFKSWTVFFETLIWDTVDVTATGMRLHELNSVSLDIRTLSSIWFEGDWEFFISLL